MSETRAPTAQVSLRDKIIADARNAADLLAAAQKYDPALYAALAGKPLAASKTALGTAVASGVGAVVTELGLACTATATTACFSQGTIDLIAGCVALACGALGTLIMHKIAVPPAPLASGASK